MARHSGGKLGAAARRLSKPSTSKSQKSKDGRTLANHKARYH